MKKHPVVSANIRAVLSIHGIGRKRACPDNKCYCTRIPSQNLLFYKRPRNCAASILPSCRLAFGPCLHISCVASRCGFPLHHGTEYAKPVGRQENASRLITTFNEKEQPWRFQRFQTVFTA